MSNIKFILFIVAIFNILVYDSQTYLLKEHLIDDKDERFTSVITYKVSKY